MPKSSPKKKASPKASRERTAAREPVAVELTPALRDKAAASVRAHGFEPPSGSQPALYTIAEVARILRISQRTLFTYLDLGILERVRLSASCVRISRSSLAKLIGPENLIGCTVPADRTGEQ